MTNLNKAASVAAETCAHSQTSTPRNLKRWMLASAIVLQGLLMPLPALAADLFQAAPVPVHRFGFATAGKYHTASELNKVYDLTRQVLGSKAIIRNGMVWDPTVSTGPNFGNWSEDLELALAREITVLPVITTNYLGGGYRMPTDAQWVTGLRQIVRMYGPNGIYKKGGSYFFRGKTYSVPPHPTFKGLFDFELWNEPNAEGNLNGAMTPQRVVQLVRIGSAAMRDEAAKQGFTINIVGPAIGGIDLAYLNRLWEIDNKYFSYINTFPFHTYIRFAPTDCDAFGSSKLRCIETFDLVRKYLDTHGGAHVHLGTTEAGTAGDRGTCTGPQVRSEELQSTISTANLLWLRGRPYLKFDFWITTNPLDRPDTYSYPCTSGIYDIPYWESKLGVYRPDRSLKPWGLKLRGLADTWRR